MSEPVSRRCFLRWLPALPALPAVLGQLGTSRFVTAQQGTRHSTIYKAIKR